MGTSTSVSGGLDRVPFLTTSLGRLSRSITQGPASGRGIVSIAASRTSVMGRVRTYIVTELSISLLPATTSRTARLVSVSPSRGAPLSGNPLPHRISINQRASSTVSADTVRLCFKVKKRVEVFTSHKLEKRMPEPFILLACSLLVALIPGRLLRSLCGCGRTFGRQW